MCVYLLPGNSEMSQQWRIHALCCAGPGWGAGRLFWQRDQILLRPTDRKTEVLSEAAASARMSEDLPPFVCCGLCPTFFSRSHLQLPSPGPREDTSLVLFRGTSFHSTQKTAPAWAQWTFLGCPPCSKVWASLGITPPPPVLPVVSLGLMATGVTATLNREGTEGASSILLGISWHITGVISLCPSTATERELTIPVGFPEDTW